MRARVEVFNAIRRDSRVEGLFVRALATCYGVHCRTVRAALESAEPPERENVRSSVDEVGGVKPAIDVMLAEDTTTPRKQRHTARRVLARLIEDHGAEELSYSTVRTMSGSAARRSLWRPPPYRSVRLAGARAGRGGRGGLR